MAAISKVDGFRDRDSRSCFYKQTKHTAPSTRCNRGVEEEAGTKKKPPRSQPII